MDEGIVKWAKRALVALLVLIPGGAAFTFFAFEASSQPRFCGSCHIMHPYYESWRTSTHNHIACVECHIPPGIASEFRKKYEALSMVARYFTGTYSTNPWTEIDDQSCLRSGCHAKRLLLGRELYQNVLFDHQPHLTEMRRGKQLRCTSCHSQIVQGSHISVTPSTCFLCHFKNTRPNTGTARCTLCHAVPDKTITTAGLSFDHGDVKRFDMQCMACHEGVVKGNGEVPRERCLTCHNEKARLARYGDTEFLHRMHVTEHKVECLHCHIEIRHQIPAREEALSTECASCHSSAAGHSLVRDLYRGIGGKGVAPQPAAMYLAGVRCEACHDVPRSDSGHASGVSCMSCHGPKYLTIYDSWRIGLAKRLAAVRAELQDVQARMDGRGDAGVHELLEEAEHNLTLVEQGHAIHNPRYALDLIESAHRNGAAALAAGGETPPVSVPWVQAPYESECLKCHFGIEYLSGTAFGREFPHGTHVVSARLRCTVCHEGMGAHGGMKISGTDCDRCHHAITRSMGALTGDECLACHTAEIGSVSQKVNFPHEKHIASGLNCEMCHTGVSETPHREFSRSAAALPKIGHAFCGACHGGDAPAPDGVPPEGADCTKCHIQL
jgi:nitrate/TMAO reductase-like tetraheme cytochrome c subunit